MPLKFLSHFWRSVEKPIINCKIELRFKIENADAKSDNIDFSINGTKLYVPAVTLSARDKQKL